MVRTTIIWGFQDISYLLGIKMSLYPPPAVEVYPNDRQGCVRKGPSTFDFPILFYIAKVIETPILVRRYTPWFAPLVKKKNRYRKRTLRSSYIKTLTDSWHSVAYHADHAA